MKFHSGCGLAVREGSAAKVLDVLAVEVSVAVVGAVEGVGEPVHVDGRNVDGVGVAVCLGRVRPPVVDVVVEVRAVTRRQCQTLAVVRHRHAAVADLAAVLVARARVVGSGHVLLVTEEPAAGLGTDVGAGAHVLDDVEAAVGADVGHEGGVRCPDIGVDPGRRVQVHVRLGLGVGPPHGDGEVVVGGRQRIRELAVVPQATLRGGQRGRTSGRRARAG